MNVTFLLPRYGWKPSGGFAVVYTYAGLLAERGHYVTVVHPRRLPAGGWPAPSGVIARLRHRAGRLRDRVLRPSIAWAAPDPRVRMKYVPEITDRHVPDADAVIATWWSTAEATLALGARKGARYHLVQGEETWYGAAERVRNAWLAPLRKIFISTWLMERALELGVPRSQCLVISNGVDTSVFRVTEPVAERPLRVAMLYSSEPYKGGATGIDILGRVKQEVPALTATLFGVGPAPRDLPDWIEYMRGARAAELSSRVYNRASVYLCPSVSEGWHLPATEAMACGCALVSSDIGGVRDYARDGDTALLFPPGDAAAGAARLTALLNDDAGRVALAQRGIDAMRRFSWQQSVERLEACLDGRTAASAAP